MMTLAERCKLATDCLPQAEYRTRLEADNVGGLAVWSIAQTLRRVGRDWGQRFSEAPAPQIVVSWHDTVHHHGTVYKASNFRFYKLTKPNGANFAGARTYTQDDAHIKGTWVYPLSKAARVLMPNA